MGKVVLRVTVIVTIVVSIVVLGITYRTVTAKKQQKAYVMVGFPKEQGAGIQKELEYISTEHDYIDRGYQYLKDGRIKEAMEQFNAVLSRGKKTSALDFARRGLVDACEKSRDYKTAADLLDKIIGTFVIPKGDMWRTAEDERLLYLRYAANGDYDLAIEHSQKALEADAQLPNRPQGANPQYYERLDDLKAAKDYILSQKQKNEAGAIL